MVQHANANPTGRGYPDVTPDAIAVANVSHAYARPDAGAVKTLNAVSLGVRKGELLCLIGPSGCGKSTLLNIIGGLVTPTAGEVRVNGNPVHGPAPKEIAYVFQENTLFPWNTILDNVTVGLEFQGVPPAERRARAMEAIEAVGHARNILFHYGQVECSGQVHFVFRQTHQDVVSQGIAKEPGHLGRVGAVGRNEEAGRIIHQCTVPANAADVRRQQTEQRLQEGGLTGADTSRHHC